jgi:hypothetical protein
MSPLSEAERAFLQHMLFTTPLCGELIDGWYYRLYYGGESAFTKKDLVVADVHTAPTDASGAPIGWVLHAGTGPVDLAVVVDQLPEGNITAFIGPVLSYYEHVSTNFKRFTDEEWETAYAVAPSFRPPLVNLYLADSLGGTRGEGPSLLTGVAHQGPSNSFPSVLVLEQNYPNPFNLATILPFVVPRALADAKVELAVYDLQGQKVRQILSQPLPAGAYVARWDGKGENGRVMASSVYFCRIQAGGSSVTKKITLLK